jgi:hypothetical protein
MNKKILKRIALGAGSVLLILTTVLAVHIYQVTRPGKIDATTYAMARIDFKQYITAEDAAKITNWFMQQNGISQFKCSPENKNAIFTFYPAKANATALVEKFSKELNYNAVRFLPSKDEMMKGCPVAKN